MQPEDQQNQPVQPQPVANPPQVVPPQPEQNEQFVAPAAPTTQEASTQIQAPSAPTETLAQPQTPSPSTIDQPVDDVSAVDSSESQQQIGVDTQGQGSSQLPSVQPVSWQAIEYLQHDKTPVWYLGFISSVLLMMIVSILLMKSWTFSVLIVVMAVALMVYSHRPPRQLQYTLSEKGIYINDQLHSMGEFKSFGVVQEPEINSLMLIPVKRFRPALTVYFPFEAGEAIVDLVGGYLPMQNLHLDAFDKIVRKLRI